MKYEHMFPDGIMPVESVMVQPMRKDRYEYYLERINSLSHIEYIACELGTWGPGMTQRFLTDPLTPDWYHFDAYALRVGGGERPLIIDFPCMGTLLEPNRYLEITHIYQGQAISYVPKYCMKMLEGRYSYWKSCIELGRMVIEKAYKERGREDELKQKHEKWFNSLLGLATLGREVAPYTGPRTIRYPRKFRGVPQECTVF